jgi:DNA-binding transcriptional ArsR family regulator
MYAVKSRLGALAGSSKVDAAGGAGPRRERSRRWSALDRLRLTVYFVFMRNHEPELDGARRLAALKALASPVRLAVLEYLKDPLANFPSQEDGDAIVDGVCADYLREKLGIAAATASRHLTVLVDCGLLVATRKKGWTFYRRDEDAIARFTAALRSSL